MLLLSSATRILATELPPRAPTQTHRCAHLATLQRNWSIGGWGRQRKVTDLVSEGNTPDSTGEFYRGRAVNKRPGTTAAAPRRYHALPGDDLLQSLFLLAR